MKNIDTCRKCKNQKFENTQGIICGLTNAKPTFEETCPEFIRNEEIKTIEYKFTKPNDKRATAAMILVGIVLFFEIITLFSDYFQFKLAKLAQEGGNITTSMIENNDLRQLVVYLLFMVVYGISAVTFIQWFRRGYNNLHQRINHCNQKEHWAVSSWFIPIICLFRPFQIMKEMWDETLELLKQYDKDYYPHDKTSILTWWWSLWIISSFAGNIVLRYGFTTDTAAELMNYTLASMIHSIIAISLAIFTLKMINSYSDMEAALEEKENATNN